MTGEFCAGLQAAFQVTLILPICRCLQCTTSNPDMCRIQQIIKIGVVSRKRMQILIAQPPAILVMEQPDALWKTSAQAFDVAVFVDFFTAPFQPTPLLMPSDFPPSISLALSAQGACEATTPPSRARECPVSCQAASERCRP